MKIEWHSDHNEYDTVYGVVHLDDDTSEFIKYERIGMKISIFKDTGWVPFLHINIINIPNYEVIREQELAGFPTGKHYFNHSETQLRQYLSLYQGK